MRWGIPQTPDRLAFWVLGGLIACSAGEPRRTRRLVLEWLPFAALLLIYDFLRGYADQLDTRAHVLPQIWVGRVLGGGSLPTVWLQRHLWHGPDHLRWYDYASWAVYASYFFVTPILAAALWLRAPHQFRRYSASIAVLVGSALATYALAPAVPPWLASRDGLIPHTTRLVDPIAAHVPFVDFEPLFEHGQAWSNDVAAIPSLHAALTLLAALFLGAVTRRKLVRVLLALYPLAMAFALVYTGEHYTLDVLLGWLYAGTAFGLVVCVEAKWKRPRRAAGTSGAARSGA